MTESPSDGTGYHRYNCCSVLLDYYGVFNSFDRRCSGRGGCFASYAVAAKLCASADSS